VEFLPSIFLNERIGCKELETRDMARTMRAGVVHAFGKPLTIDEVPIPTPGPGEVLIKVVATGVCHTGLHAAPCVTDVMGIGSLSISVGAAIVL
jgi:hypothetical protein